MKNVHVFAISALVLIAGQRAWSQESRMPEAREVKLEAKANLVLRDSPPSGWFYIIKGDRIGVVNKGDKVIATDKKTIGTLYGEYVWLKVERVDVKTLKPLATGWVFAGEKDSVSYFARIDPASIPKDPTPQVPERQPPQSGEQK